MKVTGLGIGYSSANLFAKAYGKMFWGEIVVPEMMEDDTHLQGMLREYARGLQKTG